MIKKIDTATKWGKVTKVRVRLVDEESGDTVSAVRIIASPKPVSDLDIDGIADDIIEDVSLKSELTNSE